MLTGRARIDRARRYDRWYGPLVEELNLVAKPGAGLFAVGTAVARHLARRGFPGPVTRVIRYSGQAGPARTAAIAGHEDDFEKFRNLVSLELLLATAEDVLNTSVPANIRDETLALLAGSELSPFPAPAHLQLQACPRKPQETTARNEQALTGTQRPSGAFTLRSCEAKGPSDDLGPRIRLEHLP